MCNKKDKGSSCNATNFGINFGGFRSLFPLSFAPLQRVSLLSQTHIWGDEKGYAKGHDEGHHDIKHKEQDVQQKIWDRTRQIVFNLIQILKMKIKPRDIFTLIYQ